MRTFERTLSILCLLGFAAVSQAATVTDTPTHTQTHTPTRTQTGPPSSPTASPTWTASPTVSTTPSATRTATPTATETIYLGSPTLTGTPGPSLTGTRTPTITPSLTGTRTATWVPSPTYTWTPAPSAPTGSDVIDDFEDGDLVSNDARTWTSVTDGGGSTSVVEVTGGCGHGTAVYGGRCHGICSGLVAGSWAGFQVGGAALDFSSSAAQFRSLAFRLNGTAPGLTLTVQVIGGGTVYEAVVPLSGTSWADITIATPDNEAPEDMPQFAFVSGVPAWAGVVGQITSIRFILSLPAAGSVPYDIQVDDLRWGAYGAGASDSQLADAFGVSLAWARACRGYGLSDDAMWALLVLAKHCGCHPSTVLAQRATMSWGQIAALYGMTWEQCLDEAWDLAEARGLRAAQPMPDQVLRVLRNSLPVTDPLPTVTPYVPLGPIALPPAGGC